LVGYAGEILPRFDVIQLNDITKQNGISSFLF
jgi:hypothetical protein